MSRYSNSDSDSNSSGMPILEDNIEKFDIDQQLSLYIPYVSADGDYIKETIEDFGFGKVKRVDCIARGLDDSTSMAFVHMDYWEENQLVENFQNRIKSSDKEARIVYDDPKYWIILPNKNPLNIIDMNEKITNMQSEIDILRNENEELKTNIKNLSWYKNLHETNIEYICNQLSLLKSSIYENDSKINNKRSRTSVLDGTCGYKSEAWDPSQPSVSDNSPTKNIWSNRLRSRDINNPKSTFTFNF